MSGTPGDFISGVPQVSVIGPVLLVFSNDFFFCIRKVSAYNFADDNTLSSFARSVDLLLEVLINEYENAIKWFSDNKNCCYHLQI